MKEQDMKQQIDQIVAQLTLEEKIRMIHGAGLFETGAVERMNIPALKMSDGPMGVRSEFEKEHWVLSGHEDDYVSYLPSNSAIAATWNPVLAFTAGQVLGEEARGRGKDVILAPGINVKRLANGGRNFEYLSEDPYLISSMAVPIIQGIQTADVAACVKHFALNSQETERLWVNVEIDERALREIYLPAFEAAAIKAGAYSIMGAYNLLRGQHCCESKLLLGEILRKEWGYDGTVISDWGGVHHTIEAGESALDIEMSVTPNFDEYCMADPLHEAVLKGEVKEAAIDEKVRHILLLMIRIRLIEIVKEEKLQIRRNPLRSKGAFNTEAHRRATHMVARESIVLLKNEGRTLPLKQENAGKVLVIGDNAIRRQAFGGGSAEIKALYEKTPLLGIKEFLGGNSEVLFAPGYEVPKKEETKENWQATSLENSSESPQAQDKTAGKRNLRAAELRREAVALAGQKDIDYVIFVGGLNHDFDVEGQDRESLTLPYEQDILIEELLAVRPDMTVVMLAGSAVSMQAWSKQAQAILWMSYSGMEGGLALAEVLFGEVNPSGKLAESLPYTLEESSGYVGADYLGRPLTKEEQANMDAHLTQNYEEGLLVGYRYYERKDIPVQYAFGHGLSYTSFSYGPCDIEEKETIRVSGTVCNTGNRKGKETVQIYVAREDAAENEPVKQLAGFEKLELEAGEEKQYTITLDERAFEKYDAEAGAWVFVPGNYTILVGSSSTDIRCQKKKTLKRNCDKILL
ncbi:MAG: beta-glucosidase [Agathobacter sp.]